MPYDASAFTNLERVAMYECRQRIDCPERQLGISRTAWRKSTRICLRVEFELEPVVELTTFESDQASIPRLYWPYPPAFVGGPQVNSRTDARPSRRDTFNVPVGYGRRRKLAKLALVDDTRDRGVRVAGDFGP